VGEDYALLAHFKNSDDVFKYDLVHDVVPTLSVAQLFYTVERALQRRWTVGTVKTEGALRVCLNKICDISEIR
jgi:uncharacterized membrane protein